MNQKVIFLVIHTPPLHLHDVKDEIKQWLKEFNHDRAWLGEQVGVSKKGVDNWLSTSKEIPVGKQALIRRLMDEDRAAQAAARQKLQPTAQIFSVEVDLPTFRSYSAAALAAGRTLEQWAIDELNAAAEASTIPEQSPKPSASTVTSEAKQAEHVDPLKPPAQTAPSAVSLSPIIKLPPLHLAADTPQSYTTKRSS